MSRDHVAESAARLLDEVMPPLSLATINRMARDTAYAADVEREEAANRALANQHFDNHHRKGLIRLGYITGEA